jgi:hypothetical protein
MIKKPLWLWLISFFSFVGALFLTIVGVLVVFFGASFEYSGFLALSVSLFSLVPSELELIVNVVFILIGVVGLVASYYLWKMKRIGLKLIMVLLISDPIISVPLFTIVGKDAPSPLFVLAEIIIAVSLIGYVWSCRGLFS